MTGRGQSTPQGPFCSCLARCHQFHGLSLSDSLSSYGHNSIPHLLLSLVYHTDLTTLVADIAAVNTAAGEHSDTVAGDSHT